MAPSTGNSCSSATDRGARSSRTQHTVHLPGFTLTGTDTGWSPLPPGFVGDAGPADGQPAFREQLAEWLKQGLSGVRMMELAREDPEHPYGGCGSVWRAAVRREGLSLLHEQAVADVPMRFEGLPGEYLQVDSLR